MADAAQEKGVIARRAALGGDPAVVIQAIRALGAMGDAATSPVLTRIVADRGATQALRIEAMPARGAVAPPDNAARLPSMTGHTPRGARAAPGGALAARTR